MFRSPLVWLVLGGVPGLLIWWLLFAATGPARRAVLVAGGTLVAGLVTVGLAGVATTEVAPSAPPAGEDGRSILPGMIVVLGGIGVAVLALGAGFRAWLRARKEAPTPAPTPEPTQPRQLQQAPGQGGAAPRAEGSQPRPRRVVVRGCPPQDATVLQEELQGVADLLGRDIVVFVQPRVGGMVAFLHGEAIIIQVQRPRLHLVTRAIATFLGDGVARAQAPEPGQLRGQSPMQVPPRRPRQEDLAAAIGGAEGGKGEG